MKEHGKSRKEETRVRIINVARSLFCDSEYAAVSVNSIIRDAGISKGSFYWHFPSKRDLFIQLLKADIHEIRGEESLEKHRGQDPFKVVTALGQRILTRADDDRAAFSLVLRMRLGAIGGDSEMLAIFKDVSQGLMADIESLFLVADIGERAHAITRTFAFFIHSLLMALNISMTLKECLSFWEKMAELIENGCVLIDE